MTDSKKDDEIAQPDDAQTEEIPLEDDTPQTLQMTDTSCTNVIEEPQKGILSRVAGGTYNATAYVVGGTYSATTNIISGTLAVGQKVAAPVVSAAAPVAAKVAAPVSAVAQPVVGGVAWLGGAAWSGSISAVKGVGSYVLPARLTGVTNEKTKCD